MDTNLQTCGYIHYFLCNLFIEMYGNWGALRLNKSSGPTSGPPVGCDNRVEASRSTVIVFCSLVRTIFDIREPIFKEIQVYLLK